MSNFVLALLVPVALVIGFGFGVLWQAIEIRAQALRCWTEPGVITRALAAAWDEGWSAGRARGAGVNLAARREDNPHTARLGGAR